MKGVFVILDGVADEPSRVLDGKTALEMAETPNLDMLTRRGKLDYCYPIKEGVAPESSSAVVSLFGEDYRYAPRGQLEAQGLGVVLRNGDLALRCNFATIDSLEKGNVFDRRCGRTLSTKEAKILAKEINETVKLPGRFEFEFFPGVHHRGVLVLRGGFSDNITGADAAYSEGKAKQGGEKLIFSKPLDEEEDSGLSSDLVNSFMKQSYEILEKSKINVERKKKGLFPANMIICRGPGSSVVKYKKLKGNWMALGYMPLEKGIAKAFGMDVYRFRYPKMRGMDVYRNLDQGLKKALKYGVKMLKRYKKKYDYFYIHIKETDTPGHDNKPLDKVKMIELIDQRLFGFLRRYIGKEKLIITADHTTSCRLKGHSADPVPVLSYNIFEKKGNAERFTEKESLNGKKWIGRKLLEGTLFR
jgi:2,3-bisphosphoglycerate-independent phosphoglycerate mutase